MDGLAVASLGWVDLVALAVIGLFFLMGLVRGFLAQLLGLLVLVGSLVLATTLSPKVGAFIREQVWSQLTVRVANAVGFVLILILALGLGAFILRLFRGTLGKVHHIVPFDRLFGGVLGGLKGALFVMAVLLAVVNLFGKEGTEPAKVVQDVQASRAAIYTRWAAEKIVVLLPAELAQPLNKYAQKLPSK